MNCCQAAAHGRDLSDGKKKKNCGGAGGGVAGEEEEERVEGGGEGTGLARLKADPRTLRGITLIAPGITRDQRPPDDPADVTRPESEQVVVFHN